MEKADGRLGRPTERRGAAKAAEAGRKAVTVVDNIMTRGAMSAEGKRCCCIGCLRWRLWDDHGV